MRINSYVLNIFYSIQSQFTTLITQVTFEAIKSSGFCYIAIDDITLTSGMCGKCNICLCHIVNQITEKLI